MPTVAEFLDLLLSQDGDAYVFGVEVSPDTANPRAFDCSELIEWAAGRLGVVPRVPDGSWYQARHCRNYDTLVSVDRARNTAGALLFRFAGGDPFAGGRPNFAHVAVSQGNGRTIEARSRRYGVGQFSAYGRGWTHAGLVPGLHQPLEGDDMEHLTVVQLQSALVDAGHDIGRSGPNGDGVDGDYGPKTARALAAGLTPTSGAGLVTEDTYKAHRHRIGWTTTAPAGG